MCVCGKRETRGICNATHDGNKGEVDVRVVPLARNQPREHLETHQGLSMVCACFCSSIHFSLVFCSVSHFW